MPASDNSPITCADLATLEEHLRTAITQITLDTSRAISQSEIRLIDHIKAEKADAMEEFRAFAKQQATRWVSVLLAAGDNAKGLQEIRQRMEEFENRLRRLEGA